MRKTTKLAFAMLTASVLAICGSGVAAAQTVSAQFNVTNSFGSTILLDSASCVSGSIFAPSSIASGGSANFTGTTTTGLTTCTVRYHSSNFGCQFQIFATTVGTGFTSANAYEGTGSSPHCNHFGPGVTGNQSGSFTMLP